MVNRLTQAALAAALGASPAMVVKSKHQRMPVGDVEAAKRWRAANLDPARLKSARYPSAPRSPAIGIDLRDLLIESRVEMVAALMVECPLDFESASHAYAVFVGTLAEVSGDERLNWVFGPAGLMLPEAERAQLRTEIEAGVAELKAEEAAEVSDIA